MKHIVLLFCFVSVTSVIAEDKNGYITKYDNINLNDILKNKRLLLSYTNCLLDKGFCSPDGAELKQILPDAIETGCSKCNERQRKGSAIICKYLIEKEPKIWKQLEEKYDPNGTYKMKYQEEIRKQGIDL